MNRPMIENSDRGITMNKTLAWSFLVTIVSGAIWFGAENATQTSEIEALAERQEADRARQAEDRDNITANARAISDLGMNAAAIGQELKGLRETSAETRADMARTRADVAEILRYLRANSIPERSLP